MGLSAGLKNASTFVATSAMWLVALYGCVVIAYSLAALNMLRTGAKAGDAIFLDELAPTTGDALLNLAIGVALLIVPFVSRAAFRRWRRTHREAHGN